MPNLIQNITANVLDTFNTNINFLKPLNGLVGEEDYMKLNGFEAFTQDFRQTIDVIELIKPSNFGLKNNTKFTELNISY